MDVYDILARHPQRYVCPQGCLLDALHLDSRIWVTWDSFEHDVYYCKMHGLRMYRYNDPDDATCAARNIRLKSSKDHGWSEEDLGFMNWEWPGLGIA